MKEPAPTDYEDTTIVAFTAPFCRYFDLGEVGGEVNVLHRILV